MSITTDFDTLWTETKQREATVEAKALLQNYLMVTEDTKHRLQEIVDKGTFDTIPNSIKLALNKAFTIVKTSSTSLSAADVQEVLNWAGK